MLDPVDSDRAGGSDMCTDLDAGWPGSVDVPRTPVAWMECVGRGHLAALGSARGTGRDR